MKLEVFEEKGLTILQKAQVSNNKIIFLDEIGGVELFSSVLKKEIIKFLEGEKPCIGVLKFKEDGLLLGKKKSQIGNYVKDLINFHQIASNTSRTYKLENNNRKSVGKKSLPMAI